MCQVKKSIDYCKVRAGMHLLAFSIRAYNGVKVIQQGKNKGRLIQ